MECKHYKQGVPPTKIAGALTWAEAESPDVLLLIVSNFFSNPSKEYLEKYRVNNRPRFRLKTWELVDLEENSKGKPLLLSKYGLAEDFEFLNIIHPAHLEYIKHIQINTLNCLFECFDNLDSLKRDKITGWLWEDIIRPRRRNPVHGGETLADLRIDPINYEIFKQKCYTLQVSSGLSEMFIVSLIVGFLLQAMFGLGDLTTIDQAVARQKDMLDFLEKRKEADPTHGEELEKFKNNFELSMRETPDRMKDGYKIYTYFCENVVSKLLEEKPRI